MNSRVKEVLILARQIISQPGAWTTQHLAKDTYGHPCGAYSPNACQWCAFGAIVRAGRVLDIPHWEARDKFVNVLNIESIGGWNDMPGQSQKNIVAAFDKAIASC